MRMRSALRRITGVVNSDGTIAQGTGFSVTKTATGVYAIRFPAFRGIPRLLISAHYLGGYTIVTADNPVTVFTPQSVVVNLTTDASVLKDAPFTFAIEGMAA